MPSFPKPTWSDRRGRVLLYRGDAREILACFPAGSVSFVFTDPPYGHNNNNNNDLIHRRRDR